MSLTCHVGYLQQHGSHEVSALQQLQVNVHMIRHLPTLLYFLLLRGALLLALQQQALKIAQIRCKLAWK